MDPIENTRPEAWLSAAMPPSVIRRSCKQILFVGRVLTAINHGDAIGGGERSREARFTTLC